MRYMKTAQDSSTQIENLIHEMARTLASSVVGEMRNIIVGGGVYVIPPGAPTHMYRRVREQVANAAPRRARDGRLARRTADDISGALTRVQGILRAASGPMRAEDIRAKLDLPSKAMPRILKTGLANGMLKSTGQKRATTYSLAPVKAAAKPAKVVKVKPKSAAKKPAKPTRRAATAKKNEPATTANTATATDITAPETVLGGAA
jgi:hypothetical protein